MIRLEQMPMTPLRRRFIDDMRLRNYSARTIETYATGVVRVAKHFKRSPDLLGPDDSRSFQLELLKRRVSWCLFNQTVCALRFLYTVTLGRPEMVVHIPFGKKPKTLPIVLSPEEVVRFLEFSIVIPANLRRC
ncbi:MAG: phage integrase N-terminal SAM-like domain-containing protein [Planctomycetes bacterium]|nr:phage integrase N-terminal SAM-like domain-containing protein [Planctomycetota bacterium]